jgi:hypothetical protein
MAGSASARPARRGARGGEAPSGCAPPLAAWPGGTGATRFTGAFSAGDAAADARFEERTTRASASTPALGAARGIVGGTAVPCWAEVGFRAEAASGAAAGAGFSAGREVAAGADGLLPISPLRGAEPRERAALAGTCGVAASVGRSGCPFSRALPRDGAAMPVAAGSSNGRDGCAATPRAFRGERTTSRSRAGAAPCFGAGAMSILGSLVGAGAEDPFVAAGAAGAGASRGTAAAGSDFAASAAGRGACGR